MAKAKIGSLRVDLGLDSAQFNAGLTKAQMSLGKFGKFAVPAFAAVAAAAVTVGTAFGIAIKGAIDHADQLGKTAQKVGIAVESLSRLEYAARLSDVSLEQLSTGLIRLSKNMADVATGGTGPAATAFAALGISVTDAAGQLRSSDVVFAEVAERFARMEDGATKTALATSLLGKSGAELIPLLNGGADGMKRLGDESDATGNTISGKTAKASEAFNDALTTLGTAMQGVINRIISSDGFIAGLNSLTALLSSENFQGAIVTTTNLIGGLAKVIADAVGYAGALIDVLPKAVAPGEDAFMNQNFPLTGVGGSTGVGAGAGSFGGMMATMGVAAKPLVVDLKEVKDALDATNASAKTTKNEAIDPLAARMQELSGVLTATHDPFESMKNDLTDLKTLWDEGRISAEQYQQAVQATTLGTASATLGMVGEMTGAFATLFKDNKAFAVANAVINTAEGITKALAQGGMFGFASAAAIGIAGAAQIATILSSNPGSTRAPTVAATPSVTAPAAQAAGPGTAVNVTLKGGGLYSRDNIEEMFKAINDALGDGFKLNLQGA